MRVEYGTECVESGEDPGGVLVNGSWKRVVVRREGLHAVGHGVEDDEVVNMFYATCIACDSSPAYSCSA